jgi:Lecithin retinol acyltransferase
MLHRTDRLVCADEEPPMGAHLITPRRGYLHHGIYVGEGKVVHYSGLSFGLRRGPVEEVSLARFSRGRGLWVRPDAPSFDLWEVIDRARSRVGENCYRLFTNNCEHFCEWCLRGEARSLQVEQLMFRLRHLGRTVALPVSRDLHLVAADIHAAPTA